MADIKINKESNDKKTVQCVFYIPVPAEYQALQDTGYTVIDNVIVYSQSIRYSSLNLTDSEKEAEIKSAYPEIKEKIISDLARQSKFSKDLTLSTAEKMTKAERAKEKETTKAK